MKQIEIEKGYEIDLKKTDLDEGLIFIKKKGLSYEDAMIKLFRGKKLFYLDQYGEILEYQFSNDGFTSILMTSKDDLKSVKDLIKLINIAKFLNGDWLPDFQSQNQTKWFHNLNYSNNEVVVSVTYHCQCSEVYFKSNKLALEALEILGEEIVRSALTLNH